MNTFAIRVLATTGAITLPEKILGTVIIWAGAVIAIIMVGFLVKDVISLKQGRTSIGKIFFDVLIVMLLLGVVFTSANYSRYGELFGGAVDGIVSEDNLPSLGP